MGEDCILLVLGNRISRKVNRRIISISSYLEDHPFCGFSECVPAYSSLAVYFDPCAIARKLGGGRSSYEFVSEEVLRAAGRAPDREPGDSAAVEIPVRFGGADGPDLEFVASLNGLSPDEAVEIFLARSYTVFLLGFLPGFPYLGELDPRITAPRKDTPRKLVPRGSVGIAGNQTGIYPLDSPGGWQIIGATDVPMFDPDSEALTALKAGDIVSFTA